MQYPKLRVLPSRTQMIDTFRGYNHNLRITDGEFFDMCNLTGDHFPVIAARNPRGIFGTDQAQALIDKDGLC